MGILSGRNRESSVSSWIKFVLVGLVIATALRGASCDQEPTESQCRPYIEKALKEKILDGGEKSDEEISPASGEISAEQEENSPTDEITDSTESSKPDELKSEEGGEDAESGEKSQGEETPSGEGDESVEQEEAESREEDKPETGEEASREEKDEEETGETEEDKSGVEAEKDRAETVKTESEAGSKEDDDVTEEQKDEEESREEKSGEIREGTAEESENVESGEEAGSAEKPEGKRSEEETAASAEERTASVEDDKDSKEDEEDGKESKEENDETVESKEDEDDERQSTENETKEDETPSEEEKDKDDAPSREDKDDGESKEGEPKESEEEKEKEDEKVSQEEREEKDSKEGTEEEGESKETIADDGQSEEAKRESPEAEESNETKEKDESGEQDKSAEPKPESDEAGASEEGTTSQEAEKSGEEDEESIPDEEDLTKEVVIPENLRQRDHITKILRLDEDSVETESVLAKAIDSTLKTLKNLYDNAIKPLEMLYKYRDLSNRHFGDPEIFSKPLVLFMGPWSGGKSSTINYLLDIEFSQVALRTGAEPSPAYFNILMHGKDEEILDGTQLAADWTFSGLQKFGQGLLDRLRGVKLNNRLLEKVNIVEIPGILEIRKQVQRLFPFNDACQWFIDRADIIFLVYDPAKLDVGPETEAILDQLKGREYQTRIILNKADQVKPEELMRVQGTLIWNISPLMSSTEPPIMYTTSLWSLPYEVGAPTRLLHAQERAFLRDLREAVEKRVENKIASARRFAVRVRNHAKMVDCYLTTYYNHKTFFGNRKKISDDIVENPQKYHIYEGLSTLTNISRYDLPDPDVYRDFFKINPLYDFTKLSDTCTYFRGCPINKLDVAIAYDLPELVGKYKKAVEAAKEQTQKTNS